MRVYDEGKYGLQMEFRTLLSRHGRPVPPIMILDLIGPDDGQSNFLYVLIYCIVLIYIDT